MTKFQKAISGYTKEKIADVAKVSTDTVENWQKGYAVPRLIEANRVSAFLKTTTNELFSDLKTYPVSRGKLLKINQLAENGHSSRKIIGKIHKII